MNAPVQRCIDLACCAASAVSLILLPTASAGAQQTCSDSLARLEQRLGGETPQLSPQELRTLLSAAEILADQEREKACLSLAAEIQAILAVQQSPPADAAAEAASQMVRTPLAGAEKLDARETGIGDYLETAVMGRGGQILGTVEDVLIGGNRAYLIIGSGGLVAIETDFRPVPLGHFYRLDEDTLALKLDKDLFDTAPTYAKSEIEAGPQSWGSVVIDWWADHADERPAGSPDRRD